MAGRPISIYPVFERQGFGGRLQISGRVALLIVDFVAGFADPMLFGGGNIKSAIDATRGVLKTFRSIGLPVAYSRIVFADDGSDANVFGQKVRGMLDLTEHAPPAAIVSQLEPVAGELVVRKTVPSACDDERLRQGERGGCHVAGFQAVRPRRLCWRSRARSARRELV